MADEQASTGLVHGIGRNRHPEYTVGTETLRQILLTIVTSNALTRREVADRLRLSPATVTKAVLRLIDFGYVLPDNGQTRDAPLQIRKDRCDVIGVSLFPEDRRLVAVSTDLTGAAVAVEPEELDGNDPSAVVASIARVVHRLARPTTRGLGVAVGGLVDGARGVVRTSWNFSSWWREVPLAQLIHDATGLDVEIENDANALAMYEHKFGSKRGVDDFAVALLGDHGVGFGIVSGGRLLRGGGGAGELGHAEIDPNGPRCRCLRRGCLETYILDAVGALSLDADSADRLERLERAGDAFGRVLGSFLLCVNPSSVIVYGGQLVNEEPFRVSANSAVGRRPFVSAEIARWEVLHNQQMAQGAAVLMLRDLPLGPLTEPAERQLARAQTD